jgi:hypothetical protein
VGQAAQHIGCSSIRHQRNIIASSAFFLWAAGRQAAETLQASASEEFADKLKHERRNGVVTAVTEQSQPLPSENKALYTFPPCLSSRGALSG